jgi:Predicted membrane protein (DUF2079)
MSHAARTARGSARLLRVPRPARSPETPARPAAPAAAGLRRIRLAGYAVLALQLGAMCAWTALLYHRYALTWDYAVYHQPWYLIAHGHLDPWTSVESMPFWRNDSEFDIWALAPLWWIWPHDVMLQWAQNAGVVGAEALAFGWMCDLISRRRAASPAAAARPATPAQHPVTARFLAGSGLLLLAASPWIWWSVSFDFHMESVALPFAVLLARDLSRGRRRMWAWVAPIFAAGAPEVVYVAGIGLGGVLAGRGMRLRGAALTAASVAYSGLIVVLHGDNGAPLARHYGYLAIGVAASYLHGRVASGANLTTAQMIKGIALHPHRMLAVLWEKRTDIVAALLPGGLLGIAWRPLLPLITLGLLQSILSAGWRFAQPSFQLLPVYVLVPIGTVAVLAALAARRRRAALAVAGILVAQAACWAVIWGPQLPVHWLRVSPPAAAELAAIRARIPATAAVTASQGVLGPFSGRLTVHALVDSGKTPVSRPATWFVIAPSAGTELQATASSMALIGQLAGPLHAQLVAAGAGVWAFRYVPPPGQRFLRLPPATAAVPAWAAAGATGQPVTTGAPGSWHAAGGQRAGYITDGMAWLVPPGQYQATVSLAASGPVNVEVWDNNGHSRLLTRRRLPGGGRQDVTLPVDAVTAWHAGVYSGWGPFSATFVPPLPGQNLEVRVWSPGREAVSVYSARLTPQPVTG